MWDKALDTDLGQCREKPKLWVEYKYDEPAFVITVVWHRGLLHKDGYLDGWWSATLVRIQVPSYFSFNSQLTSYRSTTSNIDTKRSSHWKIIFLSFIIYLWYPYMLIVSWPLLQRYISMIAGNQRLKERQLYQRFKRYMYGLFLNHADQLAKNYNSACVWRVSEILAHA